MNAIAAYTHLKRTGAAVPILDLAKIAGCPEDRSDVESGGYARRSLISLAAQLENLGARQIDAWRDGAHFKVQR